MQTNFCILIGFISLSAALPTGYIESGLYDNVVVIPDVHGDYFAALTSLWKAFIQIENIDIELEEFAQRLSGIGGSEILSLNPTRTIVVQLGDLLDRGPDTVLCFDLFATGVPNVIGWKVVQLLGNHEIESTAHHFEDLVHPIDYQSFSGVEERMKAFAYGGFMYNRIASSFLAMAKLVSPVPYSNPSSSSTLFVHGGIELAWFAQTLSSTKDIDEFNLYVQSWLTAPDKTKRDYAIGLLGHPTSPVWSRLFETMSDAELCGPYLDAILTEFEVARIIVGHCPQDSLEVRSRCGGKVLLIDTKMSRWMNHSHPSLKHGHPVAVIMQLGSDGTLVSLDAQSTDLEYRVMDETRDLILLASSRPFTPVAKGMSRAKQSFNDLYSLSVATTSSFGASKSFRQPLGSPVSVLNGIQSPVNTESITLFRRIRSTPETVSYFSLYSGIYRGVVELSIRENTAFAKLYSTDLPIGFPELVNQGMFPLSKLRLNTFIPTPAAVYYKFFKTSTKMTCYELYVNSHHQVSETIKSQLWEIMTHIHDSNMILGGFSQSEDFLKKFGYDPEGDIVHLIDFSTLKVVERSEGIADEQFILSMGVLHQSMEEELFIDLENVHPDHLADMYPDASSSMDEDAALGEIVMYNENLFPERSLNMRISNSMGNLLFGGDESVREAEIYNEGPFVNFDQASKIRRAGSVNNMLSSLSEAETVIDGEGLLGLETQLLNRRLSDSLNRLVDDDDDALYF